MPGAQPDMKRGRSEDKRPEDHTETPEETQCLNFFIFFYREKRFKLFLIHLAIHRRL
jgi:hypothetical protein